MILPNNNILMTILYELGKVKPGDTVWACNGQTARKAPEEGFLVCSRLNPTEPEKAQPFDKDRFYPNWYFQPKTDITDKYYIAYADLNNRVICTTKEEAETLFIQGLNNQIARLEKNLADIKALRDEQIQTQKQAALTPENSADEWLAKLIYTWEHNTYHIRKNERNLEDYRTARQYLKTYQNMTDDELDELCQTFLEKHPSLMYHFTSKRPNHADHPTNIPKGDTSWEKRKES